MEDSRSSLYKVIRPMAKGPITRTMARRIQEDWAPISMQGLR